MRSISGFSVCMLFEGNWNLDYSRNGIHKLFYYTDTSLKMYKPERC